MIPKASRTETYEYVLKFLTLGTKDEYEKKVAVETLFISPYIPVHAVKEEKKKVEKPKPVVKKFIPVYPVKKKKVVDKSCLYYVKKTVKFSLDNVPVIIKLTDINFEGQVTIVFNQKLIKFAKLTNGTNLAGDKLDYPTMAE